MSDAQAARRRGGERGGVLILTAILLPVLLVMTSMAIDLGVQRSGRRTMQARADTIALDLARLLGTGIPANQINYSTALQGSASRNNIAVSKITAVQFGTLDQATSQFIPCTVCVPTAVKVTAEEDTPHFFQTGRGHVSRSAVAQSGQPEASVLIGSFAAELPEGKNSILSVLGKALGLSPPFAQLVGFEGLASSSVPLGDVLAQLNVLSPDQVATGSVSLRDFFLATATVLGRSTASQDAANAQLLNRISTSVPSAPVDLGKLIKVDPGGGGAALDTHVNALDLLVGAAAISNGTSGVHVTNLALNNIGLGAISLGSVNVASLDLIQPTQLVRGPTGTSGGTDQVKTHVDAKLLGGALGGLANANIGIDLGTASATTQIGAINCTTPQSFDTNPTSANLLVSKVTISLTLLGQNVTITITKPPATATKAVPTWYRLDDPLNPDPPAFNPSQFTVQNPSLGLSGITPSVQSSGLLSLLSGLLNPILTTLTSTVIPLLDTNLLGPLTNQLGVNVGGAVLTPQDVECGAGVLLVG